VIRRLSFPLTLTLALLAPLATAQPAPTQPPPAAPPFGLPPIQWPQIPGLPGQAPAPAPNTPPTGGSPGLLPPLLGALSWQGEVRSVINELESALPADHQAKVHGIPMVFDNNVNTINAFAGCDEKGAPFVAATEGLLEAIDAVSQTVAQDDLFGTHTYDEYAGSVLPKVVQGQTRPALPLGIIPLMTALDPRRLSRAHELFDNMVAFTFAHELAHHYLGHTGCAVGQTPLLGGALNAIGQLTLKVAPVVNQPFENAADAEGVFNMLDAGQRRRPSFVWTERGAYLVLDFFARLERASGTSAANPVLYLQSHMRPSWRIPVVQMDVALWHQQHPG
jgi:Peptidase family M48